MKLIVCLNNIFLQNVACFKQRNKYTFAPAFKPSIFIRVLTMNPDLDVLQVKTINNCTCSNNLNQVWTTTQIQIQSLWQSYPVTFLYVDFQLTSCKNIQTTIQTRGL